MRYPSHSPPPVQISVAALLSSTPAHFIVVLALAHHGLAHRRQALAEGASPSLRSMRASLTPACARRSSPSCRPRALLSVRVGCRLLRLSPPPWRSSLTRRDVVPLSQQAAASSTPTISRSGSSLCRFSASRASREVRRLLFPARSRARSSRTSPVLAEEFALVRCRAPHIGSTVSQKLTLVSAHLSLPYTLLRPQRFRFTNQYPIDVRPLEVRCRLSAQEHLADARLAQSPEVTFLNSDGFKPPQHPHVYTNGCVLSF